MLCLVDSSALVCPSHGDDVEPMSTVRTLVLDNLGSFARVVLREGALEMRVRDATSLRLSRFTLTLRRKQIHLCTLVFTCRKHKCSLVSTCVGQPMFTPTSTMRVSHPHHHRAWCSFFPLAPIGRGDLGVDEKTSWYAVCRSSCHVSILREILLCDKYLSTNIFATNICRIVIY